nr:hypothetical protein GCM10020063_040620 [Dactylosporangium thailandense]
MTVPEASTEPSDPPVVGPAGLDGSLRPRHWVGIGVLASSVIVAAFVLPPLIMTGDGTPPQGAGGPALTPASTPATGASPTGLAGSAAPDADGGPMLAGTTETCAPASTGRPTATGAPRSTMRFEPLTVQAEDPASTLVGGAAVKDCELCDGGARVRYIDGDASVTLHFAVPSAGNRQITVVYELDGRRRLKTSVNGSEPLSVTLTGTSWNKPSSYMFSAAVPAGRVDIRFYNDEGPAPDLDKVVLS